MARAYRSFVPAAVVIPAMFVVGVACSSSSSSSSADTPAPDAGVDAPLEATNGATWTAGACGGCVVSKCASLRQACDGDPSCSAHAACTDACAADANGRVDAACVAACPLADGVSGSRARVAYDECIGTSGVAACDACTKPPSPSPVSVFDQTCGPSVNPPNACAKCEDEQCCDTYKACIDEPQCHDGLQACLGACGKLSPPDCEASCYTKYPKGVLPWARRSLCYTVKCTAECVGDVDACFACTVKGPCKEPNARCDTDEGCYLLEQCVVETCPKVTDACVTACKRKFPASAGMLYDALLACGVVNCNDACSKE